MFNEEELKRVEAERERVIAEAKRAHAESNEGTGRAEGEERREAAEEARVIAEALRAHAESNQGSGRREFEERRVAAEAERDKNLKQYINELNKLQEDPNHYTTPGARRYFRRVTWGYIILAVAIAAGLYQQRNESKSRLDDIQTSRAEISYTTCLDTNKRHDKTIEALDRIINDAIKRSPSRAAEIRASRGSTVFLIEALAPHQNCEQIIKERFGYIPKLEK